jgi:hypothetical protein
MNRPNDPKRAHTLARRTDNGYKSASKKSRMKEVAEADWPFILDNHGD